MAALGVALASAVADPSTSPRWHVVVSSAPHNPQDVWFAGIGNNTDGWHDASLRYIAKAWPQLPPHIRESIFILIDASLANAVGQGKES